MQVFRQQVRVNGLVVTAFAAMCGQFSPFGNQVGNGDRFEIHGRLRGEAACPVPIVGSGAIKSISTGNPGYCRRPIPTAGERLFIRFDAVWWLNACGAGRASQ